MQSRTNFPGKRFRAIAEWPAQSQLCAYEVRSHEKSQIFLTAGLAVRLFARSCPYKKAHDVEKGREMLCEGESRKLIYLTAGVLINHEP